AAGQIPFTPRCNHLYTWLERVGAEFETDLIVALAGCTVRDGVGTGFVGDFDQSAGNQWSGNGRAQQVFAFVNGVGAKHGIDEVARELGLQVVDEDLLDAKRFSLGARRRHFFTLADIGREGHDFAVVLRLQPFGDD